jgi:hypothetical protein
MTSLASAGSYRIRCFSFCEKRIFTIFSVNIFRSARIGFFHGCKLSLAVIEIFGLIDISESNIVWRSSFVLLYAIG